MERSSSPLRTLVVNKVDLLFMIDNSASMGDKQAYLGAAIPDLVARLATPNCINASNGSVVGSSTLDADGNAVCPAGTEPEFPAVHDMHVGIVSSSLGPRLGDQEPPPRLARRTVRAACASPQRRSRCQTRPGTR